MKTALRVIAIVFALAFTTAAAAPGIVVKVCCGLPPPCQPPVVCNGE